MKSASDNYLGERIRELSDQVKHWFQLSDNEKEVLIKEIM